MNLRPSALLALVSLAAAACGGGDSAASTPSGATASSGASAAPRTAGSVVLAGTDLFKVSQGLIEEGVAISGGLRPIETLSIRARLDGEIVQVMVREGDIVRQGALLARFESVEQEAALRSAEADKLAAEAEANTATWNLDQARELHRAGAIAERDLRAAEQSGATATARLAAAQARLAAAMVVERDTRIVAPVSGIVEKRSVEQGVRVSRGNELFTVVRTDVLELTAAVPARRSSGIHAGQVVRFVADGRSIEGRVARVSPTIDPASQSVTVFVQVPNAGGDLKGNVFATGQIIERALPNTLLVPQNAIRQPATTAADTSPFVWRVRGGTIERAPVSLGIVDEARGMVQVVSGLAVGDEVIIGNVGMLGAGMQVQLIGGEAARPRS